MLCVHLTDARNDELELVARREAVPVFCPRSNLYIETRLPPLIAAGARGRLAPGSRDRLAGFERFARRPRRGASPRRPFPGGAGEGALVRMATWQGARALGRPDLGRIARGARPGLFAIDGEPGSDPCAFVLKNVKAPRRWVVRRREAS